MAVIKPPKYFSGLRGLVPNSLSVLKLRVMKTKDAISHATSATALAELLGITQSAISQWGEDVPQSRIWQLRVLRPGWFEPIQEQAEPEAKEA